MNAAAFNKWAAFPWLGHPPSSWRLRPLKHELKFEVGWTPPTANAESFEGENRWATIGDMDSETITDTQSRISDEAVNSNSIRISPVGSLLYSFKLSVGKVAFAGVDLYTNEAIASFHPSPKTDLRFFYYALPDYLWRYSEENIYGAKLLNQERIKNARLAMPPPAEQRRIAAYLDAATGKIDRLMSLRRRQMELLREQRAALIQQAVTRGLNPRAPLKESGLPWLGQIPKHWRIIPVKYAAQVKRGKFAHRPRTDPALYEGMYPFVQTGDVATADKFITTYTQTLNDLGYDVSVEFPAGTLLMAIAANIGDLAILGFNACAPDSIVGLFTRSGVETEFLYYELTCLKSWLHALAPENTQMNLNVDRFSPQKIAMPPPDEQKEILTFIQRETAKLDALHRSYERQLALLAEYRASLIHECVTGQRAVPEN